MAWLRRSACWSPSGAAQPAAATPSWCSWGCFTPFTSEPGARRSGAWVSPLKHAHARALSAGCVCCAVHRPAAHTWPSSSRTVRMSTATSGCTHALTTQQRWGQSWASSLTQLDTLCAMHRDRDRGLRRVPCSVQHLRGLAMRHRQPGFPDLRVRVLRYVRDIGGVRPLDARRLLHRCGQKVNRRKKHRNPAVAAAAKRGGAPRATAAPKQDPGGSNERRRSIASETRGRPKPLPGATTDPESPPLMFYPCTHTHAPLPLGVCCGRCSWLLARRTTGPARPTLPPSFGLQRVAHRLRLPRCPAGSLACATSESDPDTCSPACAAPST